MSVAEIRELMELRGWSQTDLAKQLLVTPGAVTRWIRGSRPVVGPARVLMRLWLKAAREQAVGAA